MNLDQNAHRFDLEPYCLNIGHKNVLSRRACKIFNKTKAVNLLQNKLDHVNINSMHIQNMDKIYKRVLKILSGNEKI